MIAALLPDGVVVVRADEAMAAEPLRTEEAAHAARFAPKRRREFALGRACARRALARFGVRDFALLPDAERVPRWPDGLVGSLTHCRGLCLAAVARADRVAGLGLDAEPAEPLPDGVLRRICGPAERAHLAGLPPLERGDWARLAFCAKESFYKCYFPLARTKLGFRDAEVAFDAEAGRFEVRLTRVDAPAVRGRRALAGRFAREGEHLVTAVALEVAP